MILVCHKFILYPNLILKIVKKNKKIEMKKPISLLFLLLLPVAVVYFTLQWTHDALTTIFAVTLICYSFSCWLYDKVIADFKWSWFVGKETNQFCSKLFDGIGFTLMFGTITAALLICFSIFSPWGIEKMVLPFPNFGNSWDTVYTVGFLIAFIIILPLGEEAFYRVFQANQWKGMAADIMISIAYAGMNFAGLYWIMEGWGARWLFAGLAFLISMILVSIRDNMNVVYALMTRIGISLGVTIWIFFLYESVKNELPRQQPDYFFNGDVRNWFHPSA